MVHTRRIHVDRDVMVSWVNLVFERNMGASIDQIKVISRYCFLVIVRSHEEQQRILSEFPLYMDGKIVAVVP